MKRKQPIENFYDYGIDLETRTLYVGSETYVDREESGVDHFMAEKAIKGLILLDTAAPKGDKPITVILNTPGGHVNNGLAIYDAMRTCINKVNILVYGMAYSMGSWILQAGDKRYLAPNATLMIHYGWLSLNNTSLAALEWAKEEKRLNTMMEDLFLAKIRVKQPKFSRNKLKQMLSNDTILTAEQAIALNLADGLIEGK